MTAVGELSLWVALFMSVWGSGASFAGGLLRRRELTASGRRAVFAAAAMVSLAAAGLVAALLTHDFSLDYVASHTTMNTPALYLLTAFWGGTGGALLSWATALAVCSAAAVGGTRRRDDGVWPWVVGALATILAAGLVVVCFGANPYDRAEWVPGEGRGLSAHLQHPLAAPYFVTLYAAYAAAAIALALGVAASVSRSAAATLLAPVRRWSLATWSLLTLAIALRMRWTYVEPALGGLWSWDPSETANLVLWLVAAVIVRTLVARRRVAGMFLVYAGVAVVVAGVVAARWWSERAVRLAPGAAVELSDPYGHRWRFVSQGVSRDEGINYLSTGVALEAWQGRDQAGIVSAERRQYLDSAQRPTGEPAPEPGIRSFAPLDLYVLLAEVRGETAELRIGFRPLVAFVWVGAALVALGTIATAVQSTVTRPAHGDAPAVGT